MAIDTSPYFDDARLPATVPTARSREMQGSSILAIAAHVGRLLEEGRTVSNFTIGDFDPAIFPIPEHLRDGIKRHIDAGETRYPPAVGMPQLRKAIRGQYERQLGLSYPEGSVQVGAGARPPIYAAFETLVEPGDVVVYPVPTWNVGYYVYLRGGVGIPLITKPETGFMPTASDLLPHLDRAQVVLLNSPLNPAGTVIAPELLEAICEAIVVENRGRLESGRRPLMLIYDQVYWQLTFGEYRHVTPVELVPEMARYTVMVDAISKSWAGTGLRVGYAVAPPYVVGRMKPLIGHMGAWAARAEQLATADLLNDDAAQAAYMVPFKEALRQRLTILHDGLQAMKAEGLAADCLDPQGAIYLSARFDLLGKSVGGRTIDSDEDLRIFLLEEAGVAVVPFTAFGYPEGSGWVRFSVGAVEVDDVHGAVTRLRALLQAVK
jgi:aspartate aminotransferase